MFKAILKALGESVTTVSKFDVIVTSYNPNALGRLFGLAPRKTVKLSGNGGYGPWLFNAEPMLTQKEYPITGNGEVAYSGYAGTLTFTSDWRPGGIKVTTLVHGWGDVLPSICHITANGSVINESVQSDAHKTLELPALNA